MRFDFVSSGTIQFNIQIGIDPVLSGMLGESVSLLRELNRKEDITMATQAEILAAVEAQKTVEDSLLALMQSIVSENDPAARQRILDGVIANTAGMSAAILANTPQEPPPAP